MKNSKRLRLMAGLTQRQAATKIGRSAMSISFYETGRHKIPIPVAKKMAEVYGCKWPEVYEDSEDGAVGNG